MAYDVVLAVQSSAGTTDETARLIAAWGAVVSTAVLLIQLIRFRRERPRLQVKARLSTSLDGDSLSIQVVNPPTAPPITLMDVGLMATKNSVIQKIGEDNDAVENSETHVRDVLSLHPTDTPVLLQEGETRVFKVDLKSMPPVVPRDGDQEFRAFAIDAEGHFIRGNRGRFFQSLLQMGWKPIERAPGHAFETSSMLLVPDSRLARFRWRLRHR